MLIGPDIGKLALDALGRMRVERIAIAALPARDFQLGFKRGEMAAPFALDIDERVGVTPFAIFAKRVVVGIEGQV